MKEIRRLERFILISECIHLALLTVCLALPVTLLFKRGDGPAWALWALGPVIPVQLMRFVFDHVKNKPLRTLLALGIFALSPIAGIWSDQWLCFIVCGIPILISGLFIPRHRGKLIFTIPHLAALLPLILLYALGKIVPVQLLCSATVALAFFTVLNYFFYLNQIRLLTDIRTSPNTEVSVVGMIRQNRKVAGMFLAIGVVALLAVPLLFNSPSEEEKPAEYNVSDVDPTAEPVQEEEEEKHIRISEYAKKIRYLELEVPVGLVLGAGFIILNLIGIGYFVYMLLLSINKKKGGERTPDDELSFERLEPKAPSAEKERASGYEKRIRRGYEKLIKSRAPKKARLAALTPAELNKTARIEGECAETIHEVYIKTRYSGAAATREDFADFKAAVHGLGSPEKQEQDPAVSAPAQ